MAAPLTLAALRELVEELAERHLDSYTDRLKTSPVQREKDVNDALWGTVSFTKIEVVRLPLDRGVHSPSPENAGRGA